MQQWHKHMEITLETWSGWVIFTKTNTLDFRGKTFSEWGWFLHMCAIEGFVKYKLCSVRKNRWGTSTPLKNSLAKLSVFLSTASLIHETVGYVLFCFLPASMYFCARAHSLQLKLDGLNRALRGLGSKQRPGWALGTLSLRNAVWPLPLIQWVNGMSCSPGLILQALQ